MKYLYAVTWTLDPGPVLPAGVGGAVVELITEGMLTAITSDHPEPPPLDLEAARAHLQVVEAAMAAATVLPVRAATALEDAHAVRALLRARRDPFVSDLRRLDGMVELAVHVSGAPVPDELAAAAASSAVERDRGAYLLPSDRIDAFLQSVAAIEADHETPMVVTGPWPPYTFAESLPEAMS